MDILAGLHVVYFSIEDIRSFFKDNPQFLKEKKGIELLIISELANIVGDESRTKYKVGWPLKKALSSSLQATDVILRELLSNGAVLDDDVDVCMVEEGNEDKIFYRFQITRLYPPSTKRLSTDDFINILKKKFRVQRDECICLLVHIEERMSLDLDEVFRFLKGQDVPFGGIYVLGLVVPNSPQIRYYKIYPHYGTHTVTVDLDFYNTLVRSFGPSSEYT
jgi:hypothetical protein